MLEHVLNVHLMFSCSLIIFVKLSLKWNSMVCAHLAKNFFTVSVHCVIDCTLRVGGGGRGGRVKQEFAEEKQ